MNNREQFLQKLTALLKLAGANIKDIVIVDDTRVAVIFSDGSVRRVAVDGYSNVEVISEIANAVIYGGADVGK